MLKDTAKESIATSFNVASTVTMMNDPEPVGG